MGLDSTSPVISLRSAEYSEVKADNPTILSDLGQYITLNCPHGAKNPLAFERDGATTHLCCLKCAVEFILKDRVKARISSSR